MFSQYQKGQEVFKLYGVPKDALNKAKTQIEQKSLGKICLDYSVDNQDALCKITNNSSDLVLFDEIIKSFINTFSKFIYANEDISLANNAVQLLKLSGQTLCSAESFTGGAFANAIVSVSGASEVFYEGIVCYNTDSKIKRLNVQPLTVKTHTVVSREVAFEMVRGLIESGNCDVAVATTGYASPTGDESKPCGLCFIAVANKQSAQVTRHVFSGSREEVIRQGKEYALFALCKLLRG